MVNGKTAKRLGISLPEAIMLRADEVIEERMPRSDLDITRTAHLWIQQHGRPGDGQGAREDAPQGDSRGRRHLAADHRGDRHAGHAAEGHSSLRFMPQR
jgi:hypothetical protein